jgi:hypothetical protein
MNKLVTFLLIVIFSSALFIGCENSITGNYETVRAKNIELTDGSETLAKITAAKDADGKVIVAVKDKNGNLIGTITAK